VRVLLVGCTALLGLVVFALGCAGVSDGATAPSCVPPTLNASAALAGSRVTVSPAPDTRDASPTSQISLLGAPAGALSNIAVRGTRSGTHTGRLEAYSQDDGASFLPTRPFVAGESVSVRGELREAAQTIPFAWSFTVAVPDTAGAAGASARPAVDPHDYQSFRSRPDLLPPAVTVTARSTATAPGDIFLAPYSGPGQYGPMILDESGSLLWFKALSPGTRAADFRVQQYEGKPVLTWWQDPLAADGSRKAGIVIANSAYQTVAIVRAGNGYQPDLHEFQIAPQGTALITIYSGIDCDTSAVGGPRDGAVADTLVQELDLRTGLVRYEWHSLDHVALADSYASAKPTSRRVPFDFFHINSIDVEQDGDLLVDSRNTWAAYDLDPRTGQVRWRLGGKHSSFAMGAGTATAWQHDARQQPDGEITFFDNGATPKVHPQSRAIEVSLDMAHMTATLTHDLEHATPLVAGSQGNVQALANGDWMVGWGQVPDLSEFSGAGQLLFDAHLPAGYESYRAYRFPWVGQPTGAPALAAVAAHGRLVLYASWNGASEVASWRVLVGSAPNTLVPLAGAPKSGFETAIPISATVAGPYAAAQALNGAGVVIGVSPPVKI
jgi:Arylsulfotransferase (ASST)